MLEKERKGIIYVLTSMMLLMLLSSCRIESKGEEGQTTSIDASSKAETEYIFLEDEEIKWKDNSLDDWQAAINLPIKEIKAEGEMAGGILKYIACEAGAVRFKTHLLNNYEKSWSGASGINDFGEEFSAEIKVDLERLGTQVDLLGPVSGEKAYVAINCLRNEEGKVIGFWLYRLGINYEKLRDVWIDISMDKGPADLSGDAEGNWHLIFYDYALRKYKYVILSAEGSLIFEAAGDFSKGLREFGKGRIAVCESGTDGRSQRILEADISQGILLEIGNLSFNTVYAETNMSEKMIYFVTPVNSNELAWCGKEGLYLCNVEGKETRVAYRWANHGIMVHDVRDIYAGQDGTITLIYKDAGGMNVLLLKPTEEKMAIKSITLATSPYLKDTYAAAAAYFNKTYPSYNIIIKDDYDETSLLTQLGSGTGPVLVDTALTGFEDLEKLWQPLDGFFEESGLMDELIPEAMELGKIEGTTYGIVTEFFIRALVITDPIPADWDYAGFLNSVEKFEGVALTNEYYHDFTDARFFFFQMLSNSMEDNVWLDVEKDTSIFGTPDFERVLKASEKAAKCPTSENGKALRDEEALCEVFDVTNVERLVQLRARQDTGERILGYPTKNGAKYRLVAKNPISLRRTASDEEKAIAYTFFKILLSHETAEEALHNIFSNKYFSVRKDMLEISMDSYARKTADGKLAGIDGLALDRKRDGALFDELLRNSIVQKNYPSGLQHIFDEELEAYLRGEIGGKILEDHLKSRVWLYLHEND